MKNFYFVFFILFLVSCGKQPASLLRVGQSPLYNFPLYVSSSNGSIYKFDKDGNSTVFASGLSDPRGVAIDKFQNLYVAEYGNSRVVKYNLTSGASEIVIDSLSEPTSVAVDSFGDVYVTQEGTSARNIVRVKDRKIIRTFTASPSAIAFGVNDLLLVGLFESSRVSWGGQTSSPTDTVLEPIMIATDANGRVFVAQGTASNAKVFRYHQEGPSGKAVVADGLNGASGIAVDPVGNIYIAEPGSSRIALADIDGNFYFWASVPQPQQLAFTPY
jgi:secreted PhoX family phosphatase